MSFVDPNSAASTPDDTSTSTTRAPVSTPRRSFASTSRCWSPTCSAIRIRRVPARWRRPTWSKTRVGRSSTTSTRRASEYTAVFTANATGALKLAGEAYPFAPGGRCLFTFDNHNSVNGIREFAQAKGASVEYAPLTVPDLRIDRRQLGRLLEAADPNRANLFAFPAQSNFSGVKHPLELIDEAHHKGWHVLLDAAAFVPTNRLDLTAVHPDFVAISFYKMFGYPTGVGCLIVRNTIVADADPAVVCRRHRQLRDRPGTDPHAREARSRLRGRDAQLPEHSGGANRVAVSRARRHRCACGARVVP